VSRDARYDVLFEPVRIGPKRMKNRFYQTPYSTGFGVDKPRGEAAFRAVRAEGGWAVVNTDISSIHPESDLRGFCADSRIWSDADVRALSLIADGIHEHEALAGIELYYGGSVGPNDWSRLPARGVSQRTGDLTWSHSCYEMDTAEIAELRGFFVEAARRSRKADFDIVNVCANSQMNIVQQFLMPFFNHRMDEYGGSLENRARFLAETLEEIRGAVDDCALTVRMTVETFAGGEGGFHADGDAFETIAMLDHLVDFWDLDVGGMSPAGDSAMWGVGASPSRLHEAGWENRWIAKVRGATAKPIVGVGRFTSPDLMAQAVRSGPLDIIGAARPGLSDPYLPRKIEEGRIEDLRECIGCNVCVLRYSRWVPVNCTQNPTAGEEYRRGWHPERFEPASNVGKGVLVVGAGPAGMECAMVLGKRSFEHVHLVEAERQPGGAMRWIPRLPGLGEWARVVDYRQVQIERPTNVEFIPGKALSTADVLDYGAEIVIVATGSHWATDGVNPASQAPIDGASAADPNVLTPEQIMVEGKPVPGERVIVFDADGYFMGVSLAEHLARDGKRVTIVSPAGTIATTTFYTEEGPGIHRRLLELGVELEPGCAIDSYRDGVARGHGTLLPGDERAWEADSLVLVTQRFSDDGLYRELKEMEGERAEVGIGALWRVGDCVAPRLLADAIFDGHRLGREIDSGDPGAALPFRIEGEISPAAASAGDGRRDPSAGRSATR
jgi:dimethylamine/trimethylamine dehydrogenase